MTRHDKLKQFFKENFDLTLSDNFKPCINAWVKNPPIEIDDDCSTRSCATCKARTWWDDDDEYDDADDARSRSISL